MKHKNVVLFVCGFISATAVFIFSNTALASSVLQAIYVDLTPIKVFIEGSEKTPPDDMKPLVYNDRVYVPLRYIGEAFGKQVDWNGATRTVTINTPKTLLNSWSETFIDTPLSKQWKKAGDTVWTFDGPNGLKANGDNGELILDGVLPDGQCNYTIEFEMAATQTSGGYSSARPRYLSQIYLGRDSNNNLGDFLSFNLDKLVFNGVAIAEIKTIDVGSYVKTKLQIADKQVDIYFDGVYLTSQPLEMDKSAFAFHHTTSKYVGDGGDYYIRNFKITINS